MSAPKDLKFGDPCPGCGGTLRKAPQATEAERARAAHRDDPHPLPPHYDTATLEQIEEHGELWKCPDCGYPHRFKPEAVEAAAGDDAAAPPTKKRTAKGTE